MKYKIERVINNSAIMVQKNSRIAIGLGNGIGFGKKAGDYIEGIRIEKFFDDSDNQFIRKMSQSLENIDVKYFEIVDEIIKYASKELNEKLPDTLYIVLAEHLCFAKERLDKGIIVPCPMLPEIKGLYRKEYVVAKEMIQIVNKRLKTNFEKDEVGLIAMHLLNVTANSFMNNRSLVVTLASEIIEIVQKHFNCKLDEDSREYNRFLIHISFLSSRVFAKEQSKENLQNSNIYLDDRFTESQKCADEIVEFIEKFHKYKLSNDEITYLVIHIQNCIGKIGG